MQVNMMLHHLLIDWRDVRQQDYQFTTGQVKQPPGECRDDCEFPGRVAKGDAASPRYLMDMDATRTKAAKIRAAFRRMCTWLVRWR